MPNFNDLTFEKFRVLANDSSLSCYEKIGFPDSYRSGKELSIYHDILMKLALLKGVDQTVLDIGPGCSELPYMLIDLCEKQRHTLILADSEEMLSQLPSNPTIKKIPGRFPQDTDSIFQEYSGKINVILCYSVFHYIFAEDNIFNFIDKCVSLLAPGGQFLIGDIPNISKRKRFFASNTGIEFHRKFTNSDETPTVQFNHLEPNQLDDAIVMSIFSRYRLAGYDVYILPQNAELPMANRREDILITRP